VRHQIAARRSTKIFRQTTAPTGDVIDGDEWFDTDDGNAYYVRVAGAWVATKTGTGGLEDGAAAVINDGTGSLSGLTNAAESDLVSLTIDSGGKPIYVSASINANGGYSARDCTVRLKLDGVTQLTKVISSPGDPSTVGNQWFVTGNLLQYVISAPSSGTRTIKLTAIGSDAVYGVTIDAHLYLEGKKR